MLLPLRMAVLAFFSAAAVAQSNQAFEMVLSGICLVREPRHKVLKIYSQTACDEAAIALGLDDTTSEEDNTPGPDGSYLMGCYYSGSTLYFNPGLRGPYGPCSPERPCICYQDGYMPSPPPLAPPPAPPGLQIGLMFEAFPVLYFIPIVFPLIYCFIGALEYRLQTKKWS